MLDVWPAFPLVIRAGVTKMENVDNIVAALKHSDRVKTIDLLVVRKWQLKQVLAAMQGPFPELTDLQLETHNLGSKPISVLSDSLLAGSILRLQFLSWTGIAFPNLPNLLLVATRLVDLRLWNIPYSGYFSPEAAASSLFALTSLESLCLAFQPFRYPNMASHPPPSTRSVLSVLISFEFEGERKYLDDLMARIDFPRLNNLTTTLYW
jgi:hypothetical protein